MVLRWVIMRHNFAQCPQKSQHGPWNGRCLKQKGCWSKSNVKPSSQTQNLRSCNKLKLLDFAKHTHLSTFQYGFLSRIVQSWLWSTFAWTYPLASSPLGPSIPVLLSSTLFGSTAENITFEEQKTVQTLNKALVSLVMHTSSTSNVMKLFFSALPSFPPQSTPPLPRSKKNRTSAIGWLLVSCGLASTRAPAPGSLSARPWPVFLFLSAIHSGTRNEFSLNRNYELIHGLSRAFMVFIDKETTWNYHLPKTNRLYVAYNRLATV